MNMKNEYLEQVLQQQVVVDEELRANKQRKAMAAPALPAPARRSLALGGGGGGRSEGAGLDYRITGFWRFKTVVVPPNIYVVHTRRGQDQPVNIGLGRSFRYNPATDAFLLVPAAVQTLLISASCICLERQGIVVQAYMQWIVDDIATAYRKLDFSDREDPMRLVNVQLREQAEAAIKDKVATMSIDDVLSDKQPIIEELISRLRSVAEGNGREGEGLGLKIVTIQIKEAVVSSTNVWENLQKPFRAEREKVARMAVIEAQREIKARELENRRHSESAEIETEQELARLRDEAERRGYDRTHAEQQRRQQLQEEAQRRALAEHHSTELARRKAELALELEVQEQKRQQLQAELATLKAGEELEQVRAARERKSAEIEQAIAGLRHQGETARQQKELELLRTRRAIENDLSASHMNSQLIARLPEIAQALPRPQELRTVAITRDGQDPWSSSLLHFLESARTLLAGGGSNSKGGGE